MKASIWSTTQRIHDKNFLLLSPKEKIQKLEIEITPLFPEEEVFAKRTFEEKLSFRQNFLTLGFSYGKGAGNGEVGELVMKERVHHTLPEKRVLHDEMA